MNAMSDEERDQTSLDDLPDSGKKDYEYTIAEVLGAMPVKYPSDYDKNTVKSISIMQRPEYFATIRRLHNVYKIGFSTVDSTVTEHGIAILQHMYGHRCGVMLEHIDSGFDVSIAAATKFDGRKNDKTGEKDHHANISMNKNDCFAPMASIAAATGVSVRAVWHAAAASSFLTWKDLPQHFREYFEQALDEFDREFRKREIDIVPSQQPVHENHKQVVFS